jgi:hypothetical protein
MSISRTSRSAGLGAAFVGRKEVVGMVVTVESEARRLLGIGSTLELLLERLGLWNEKAAQ